VITTQAAGDFLVCFLLSESLLDQVEVVDTLRRFPLHHLTPHVFGSALKRDMGELNLVQHDMVVAEAVVDVACIDRANHRGRTAVTVAAGKDAGESHRLSHLHRLEYGHAW